MVEQGEKSLNPLARIFRDPKYLGARLFLATIIAGGTACTSETAAKTSQLRCPETPTEVSYLVGGDPRNWKLEPFIKGAWFYEGSDDSTVLYGAPVGRIDVPNQGRIARGTGMRSRNAWYVCPESLKLPEQDSTPIPTPAA